MLSTIWPLLLMTVTTPLSASPTNTATYSSPALDALLAFRARQVYLQLVGQAICTEAAARQMREEKSEKQRRRQAVDDLVAMQRDAQRQTEPASDEIFADALGQTRRVPAVKPAPKPPETTGGHRRRRQAGFTVIIDDSTKQVQ